MFVDEASALRRPAMGLRAAGASPFETLYTPLLKGAPQELATTGAPARVYLLSDLWGGQLDAVLADVRLAVVLNAFVLSPEQRAALGTKLQAGGRTVVWQHSPALLEAAGPPNAR